MNQQTINQMILVWQHKAKVIGDLWLSFEIAPGSKFVPGAVLQQASFVELTKNPVLYQQVCDGLGVGDRPQEVAYRIQRAAGLCDRQAAVICDAGLFLAQLNRGEK